MCTAITYKNRYFGRNLDIDCEYGEAVTFTPRGFRFQFGKGVELKKHYAILGMAKVQDDYPLYFDAINEKGVCMAGLSFHTGLRYHEMKGGKDNIAPFEFIPWVLGQCGDMEEVKKLLDRVNIIDLNFSDDLPNSPLHWFVADRNSSVTVETVKDGLKVYDNPVGVLTNDPEFGMQMFNLNNYLSLTADVAENRFSDKINLESYSKGMGGIGLPGDLSSMSRFVKVCFTKLNSLSQRNEDLSQFFHILESAFQQKGCVRTGEEKYEITEYSSCCDLEEEIYYYKTYGNCGISAVDMKRENLDGNDLKIYELNREQSINYQN